MNEQLSFEEAKRLSIIKWEEHILNDLKPKEIENLICMCGFCERWQFDKWNEESHPECNPCEFGKACGKCCDDYSLYDLWSQTEEGTEGYIDLSKQILEAIKQLKENS